MKKIFRVIMIVICLLLVYFGFNYIKESRLFKREATLENGWNLILVNQDNYIPDNYTVELVDLANGQQVDQRIYPDLQAMFDQARSEGLHLFVASSYRSEKKQQQLLDDKVMAYLEDGFTMSKAYDLAKQWVALPGTSEHQLGLAVDINADTNYSNSDDVYNWLKEHSYQYGFIKRYPEDKTKITGIINEPWHYRYVGREAALYMYEHNLCLEEYLSLNN